MAIKRRPARPATARLPQRSTGRTSLVLPTRKNNTPLIIGGVAGGALLLILFIWAASGSTSSRPDASNTRAPAPVDVSGYERDGLRKCEEGRALILRSYDTNNKTGLQRGIIMIHEGNSLLEKANRISDNKYDTRKYNQALKMARMKVLELK